MAAVARATLDTRWSRNERGPIEVIADEVLVTLQPGAGEDAWDRVAADTGLSVRAVSRFPGVARLAAPPDELDAAIARVSRHPLVKRAGPLAVMRAAGGSTAPIIPPPSEISRKQPKSFVLGNLRLFWDGNNDDPIVAIDRSMDADTTSAFETFSAADEIVEAMELQRVDLEELSILRRAAEREADSAKDAAETALRVAEDRLEDAEDARAISLKAIQNAQKVLDDTRKKLLGYVANVDKARAEYDKAATAVEQAQPKDLAKALANADKAANTLASAQAVVATWQALMAEREQLLAQATAADAQPLADMARWQAHYDLRAGELVERKLELKAAEDERKAVEHALSDLEKELLLKTSLMLLAQNTYFEKGAKYDEDKVGVQAPLAWLQWTLTHLGVPKAVREGMSGKGVAIAVLDTGVAYEDYSDASGTYAKAPDLAGVAFFGGYDFVNDDDHANDDNGHGTQMTTTMVGLGATLPIAGNASILPIKVLDENKAGTELSLVEGIVWAVDQGADVINMSLAFPSGYLPSPLLEQAIAYAKEHGVVLVAATGNDGDEAATYPAGFPEVIAVGAYVPVELAAGKVKGVRAKYTNGRGVIDVLAPAGAPDQDDNGDGYPDAAISMTFAPGNPLEFGYWLQSGTSVAAAEASAVVALLLEAGERPQSVATRIQKTADPGSVGGGFEDDNGAGRLDAGKAVTEALHKRYGDACGQTTTLANVSGAIIAPSSGERQGVFRIELQDADTHRLNDVTALVRIRGASNEHLKVKTVLGKNYAEFKTKKVKVAEVEGGIHWEVEVDGVKVPATLTCPEWLSRPASYVHIEERSMLFLANLGAGLISSAVIARLDAKAAKSLSQDNGGSYELQYTDTYLYRSLGTGLISSARVAIFDFDYLATRDLLSRSFVFHSTGTGLISSAIIVDQAFMSSELLLMSSHILNVRSFPRGTSLAASAVADGGSRRSLSYYLDQLNPAPAILRMNHGPVQSEIIVIDRRLLADELESFDIAGFTAETAPAVAVDGTGLISSARVFDLTASNVLTLGYDWNALATRYLSGTGLISSAIIASDQQLEIWSPSFMAFITPRFSRGMSLERDAIIANNHRDELQARALSGTGVGAATLFEHPADTPTPLGGTPSGLIEGALTR
ncbi:MAG: hypothetical protein CVU56_12865 [Deltaproteobacteria bacterium HGW-Deltaproteobacteria-14]|jgi:hypothetical protein|nr:MAG: hypothetical protein CVU56_12865 [Deltaproteobacteria bacterium HGW-Deltaproteobacteria-14]